MLKKYLNRMKGGGKSPPVHSTSWIFWSWIGSFIGLILVAFSHKMLSISSIDNILLIGSFGASAVLIYGTPHVPYAQPRNLIGGHFISALLGVAMSQYLHFPIELLAALAVSISIVLMHLTRTLHPPGGATALIAIIGGDSIQQLGFMYVLQPVMTGVLIMLVVAVLVNNITANAERHYPKCWW